MVVLSSVAGERVRKDNFVYGSSKAGPRRLRQGLGDSLVGSGATGHGGPTRVRAHADDRRAWPTAPFATTRQGRADDIVERAAQAASEIVWSPGMLRYVFSGLAPPAPAGLAQGVRPLSRPSGAGGRTAPDRCRRGGSRTTRGEVDSRARLDLDGAIGGHTGDAAAPRPPARAACPLALLVEARPKQWVKNVLVFAAPGAAGVLTHGRTCSRQLHRVRRFCLAASGTYFLNDAADVEADRLHPKKRFRPIAAGEIPLTFARVVGVVLILGGIGVVVRRSLAAGRGGGLLRRPHHLLHDLAQAQSCSTSSRVAAGFVLRAIGGAAATHVAVSNWFFIVATFGSLFMVAGKRRRRGTHRRHRHVTARADARRVHAESYLELPPLGVHGRRHGGLLPVGVREGRRDHHTTIPFFQLSIVPFSLAILRYALLVDQGRAVHPRTSSSATVSLQVIGLCGS